MGQLTLFRFDLVMLQRALLACRLNWNIFAALRLVLLDSVFDGGARVCTLFGICQRARRHADGVIGWLLQHGSADRMTGGARKMKCLPGTAGAVASVKKLTGYDSDKAKQVTGAESTWTDGFVWKLFDFLSDQTLDGLDDAMKYIKVKTPVSASQTPSRPLTGDGEKNAGKGDRSSCSKPIAWPPGEVWASGTIEPPSEGDGSSGAVGAPGEGDAAGQHKQGKAGSSGRDGDSSAPGEAENARMGPALDPGQLESKGDSAADSSGHHRIAGDSGGEHGKKAEQSAPGKAEAGATGLQADDGMTGMDGMSGTRGGMMQ